MNDVLLKALLARIEANEMTIEQVPIPLRDGIIELINEEVDDSENTGVTVAE